MISAPLLAQSNIPGVIDDRNELGQNTKPNSQTDEEMQNNPAVVRPNNPAMVNPSDPTGVNSNTPSSPGAPPSSGAPGMNPGSQPNVAPPPGH